MKRSAPPRPHEYGLAVVGWTLVASFLLVMPSYFLAIGVQAIGASTGLWAGDPNSNDGEEVFATSIGLFSSTVILGGLLWLLLGVRKRYGVTSALPAVIGMLVLIAGYICLWAILFQPVEVSQSVY
ncbi:hypothetical protein HDC94_000739 [Leifsonia sp. AK011]|uniref:hypothetical protein n=1 Tax=Leifsonia sp. AK011 TaxID=2723075 RepID=UPI0015C7D055|nr:hypothetical protein [Leifsonia sp. AK011]NYF09583.1 hypothetical protein [Leifsonia sp. AK011]